MKLANKHIFVTGGAKGIGAAIVQDAAGEGAAVSFIDIDVSAGENLAAQLNSFRKESIFYKGQCCQF